MNTEILNIPVTVYKVQLKLKRNCNFPFYHGMQIYSLCCNLFDKHPLGLDVLIHPVESGIINFHQNEFYNFGLTILGSSPVTIPDLKKSLEDIFIHAEGGDISSFFSLNEISQIETDLVPAENISGEIDLRFITPLRHPRRKKEKGKTFFDPSFFDPEYFLERLYFRVQDLTAYLGGKNGKSITTQLPKCKLLFKNLMWVDIPSSDTIGGITGSVKFNTELDEYWSRVLWLGQYIHAGRNSSFGLGKYIIENCRNKIPLVCRAKNFLEKSVEQENIREAYELLKKNNSAEKDKFEEWLENDFDNAAGNLVDSFITGKYKPSHLTGFNIPKKNGRFRSLAVPEFRDRLLQKAVNNIIMPSIDRLLEESSFAYRKGISRIGAANAIVKAKKEGFKFVIKSDIECFFDNVDWNILFKKLDVLFYGDPLLRVLKDWITQPVYFNGRVLIRDRGLPQGAVISPVLANLYLDEFDEILGENFKLIRYADDFLILCRSKNEVDQAVKTAEDSLEKLNLEMNKDKTSVDTFEHDFRYLGYLFHQSAYSEIKPGGKSFGSLSQVETTEQRELPVQPEKPELNTEVFRAKTELPEDAFKDNWAADIIQEDIKPVEQVKKISAPRISKISESSLQRNKYPLYINGSTNSVKFEGNALVVKEIENPKAPERKFPFGQISSLVFMGIVRISFPAVVKLNLSGIPVYFTNQNGKLYLSIPVEPKNYKYWLKQQSIAEDEAFSLEFARQIVTAKIHNSISTLAKNENTGNEICNTLNSFIEAAKACNSIDVLRGIEGKASAVYFEGYCKLFSPDWKFNGRVKHPPKDPVNCMLSVCYMVLFNHIATALQITGLNPDEGFYHISRGRYPALASDLIEEFRFIADRCALYVINRKIITAADFTFNTDGKYPCSMSNEARIKLIRQMEMRLDETLTTAETEDAVTYFNYFYLKANSILDLIKNRIKQYQPLLTR